jgi:phenylalanyl-tRNA synthetase alpha chain
MDSLNDVIAQIREEFDGEIKRAQSTGDFDSVYLKYFSKSHGVLTELMKELPKLSVDERKVAGPELNKLQNEIKAKIETEKNSYAEKTINDPTIDLTYNLPPKEIGMLHPTTQLLQEMNNFFRYYGFSIGDGPEIETYENNFGKMNLPIGHPATDLQDSLFISEPNILLRTQTSPVEARVLSTVKPPIRMVVPGRVYRNETASATNGAFFQQYQGFAVDKGITIEHLKATLQNLIKHLFGEQTVLRFRYKYYPEVSPGMGTDIQCTFCHGAGCPVCKQRGWIEVLGSGMIHYNTLKMCGIDPEEYTGFAFGLGVERLVMAKFVIPDLRKLYWNELVYK